MGSKDAPHKMQFLGAIQKSGKSRRYYINHKSGGKSPQIQPSRKQNRSESQCSCIFQELMNRDKYAYVGWWVKYALEKNSCVSEIPSMQQKKRRMPVSVFLHTLQLTALLSKSLRLRLHCYSLTVDVAFAKIYSIHVCCSVLQCVAGRCSYAWIMAPIR